MRFVFQDMTASECGAQVTRTNTSTAQFDEDTTLKQEALARVDQEIERLIGELAGSAPLLDRIARYHLGLGTTTGESTPADEQIRVRGKRVRPLIAMLACTAAGGTLHDAAPLAAAIELLHNFTLVHDDIQDRSPNRRHRPTVWNVWGDAQAINTGDALFAAAQIGVLGGASPHLSADHLLVIARAFNRMTIDIVRGQVLDIEFEGRNDVTPDDYLDMIRGKTSAIVQFAAWAGALAGGASIDVARGFAEFGASLGIGFQIRDDALGVWGAPDVTGKDTADDIRRRKQSLPVLMLRSACSDADRRSLDRMFGGNRIAEDDVFAILSMFQHYGIADQVEAQVRAYHDAAENALRRLGDACQPEPLRALQQLTDRLAIRAT